MKKIFKIRKVRVMQMPASSHRQNESACLEATVAGLRQLELAVRSLNLKRTP